MTPNPIRLDAPPANDNSVTARADESSFGPLSRPLSREPEMPVVSVPADRAEHAYACAGNLILPLRFARRLPGWSLTLTSATEG
jgi:hypothetical protein